MTRLDYKTRGTVPDAAAAKKRMQWQAGTRRTGLISMLNLLLIWVTAAVLIWQSYHDEVGDWQRIAQSTSLTTTAYVQQAVNTADLVLRSMQDWVSEGQINSEEQFRQVMSERRFHDALHDRLFGAPQISVAAIAASNGDIVNSSATYPVTPFNIADLETFTAQLGANPVSPAFGRLMLSHYRNRWTFYLSRRVVSSSGKFLGVMLVGLDAAYFSDLFERVALHKDETISLFRKDGALLATTIKRESLLGNTYNEAAPIHAIAEGRSGTVGLVDVAKWSNPSDHTLRILAPRLVGDLPLLITISIGPDAYLEDFWDKTYVTVAIALLLTGLTFYITVRFRELAAQSEKAERLTSEQRLLATLIDTPAALCAVVDRQGKLLYCNERFSQLLGPGTDPETPFNDPALRGAEMALAFATTGTVPMKELDLRLERPGQPVRYFHFSASRQVLPDLGECAILVGQDETDRHQAQLAIAQSAKMVTLGEMTTGMAHELSQPLNVIRMAAQNALSEMPAAVGAEADDGSVAPMSDAEFRPFAANKLKRIMTQVDRAADIIARMRIFGRAPSGPPSTFDARDACRAALALVGPRLCSLSIAVRDTLGEQELPLLGQQNQLEQVIVNLLLNARDALNDGHAKDKLIEVTAKGTETGRILITVSDNGPGIPAEIRERIFEPFFTAKPLGQGTGLGLALSFGIVRDAGGTLSLVSSATGAAFQIDLPTAATA